MNTPGEDKIRVLLISDDNIHSGGYYTLAKGLSAAGLEVILGGAQTPREIAEVAIQEDVSLIGYRIMCADPLTLVRKLCRIFKEEKRVVIPIIVGGIIPQKQIPEIKKLGVFEVFGTGSSLPSIVETIKYLSVKNKYLPESN